MKTTYIEIFCIVMIVLILIIWGVVAVGLIYLVQALVEFLQCN